MVQAVLRVEGLPDTPLDAAAAFHSDYLPEARATLAGARDLVLIFPATGHEHYNWRLAAVQELAREAAPLRVNGLVGDDPAALETMVGWLATAQAITGQLLAVDGNLSETV